MENNAFNKKTLVKKVINPNFAINTFSNYNNITKINLYIF